MDKILQQIFTQSPVFNKMPGKSCRHFRNFKPNIW